MNDDSSDGAQHAAGLAHGFKAAMKARKRVKPKLPETEMQQACATAVRNALETAVVETLYSDSPEPFFDGLLLAQRSLTVGQRRHRGHGGPR